MVHTATLVTRTTFATPSILALIHRAETLLLFVCDLIPYDLLLVCTPYLWHVAIFNVVVKSFKCPTFTLLGYVGGHNHAYGFLSNCRFGFVIPRLESRPILWDHHSNMFNLDHQIVINALVWIWTIRWETQRVASAFTRHATCMVVVDRGRVFIPLSDYLLSSLQIIFSELFFQIFQKYPLSFLYLTPNNIPESPRKKRSLCLSNFY